MTCNFRVGQKVVCVSEPARRDMVIDPVEGVVYTVRGVSKDHRGDIGIHLSEIVNRPRRIIGLGGDVREPGFFAYHFRPVSQRKTDISIFKALLTPSKEQVSA